MNYEDVSGGDTTSHGTEVPASLPQGDGADKPFEIRRIKDVEPLLPPDCGVCNLGSELDVDRDTF